MWKSVVSACEPTHFSVADEALLSAYCGSVVLERRASLELRRAPVQAGKLSPWLAVHEKAIRALSTLAVRLRLGPAARLDPRTAARRMRGSAASVYELGDAR